MSVFILDFGSLRLQTRTWRRKPELRMQSLSARPTSDDVDFGPFASLSRLRDRLRWNLFCSFFFCCDPWYKKGHKKDPRNKIAKDSPRRCTKSFTRYKSMFPAGASSSVRNFSYFRLFWQRRLLVCVDGSDWISVSQEIAWFSMLS